jgi:hypothetical protein
MVFLALPQLAPKINTDLVPLIPSFIGIAHGVERGQDEARRNKEPGPKSTFGSDLDKIDEWLDVGRYINRGALPPRRQLTLSSLLVLVRHCR